MSTSIKIAACHTSPVFLSASATTQKCISHIHTAASNHADLVVFPETYIPAFPVWSAVLAPSRNHDIFALMAAESVYVDGPEVLAIRQAAKECGIAVSVGISEKVRYSCATMFNTNLVISAEGDVVVHHRKLVPTFFEKLTWSPGDGNGLRVFEVGRQAKAKVGVLVCGENTNPLARYAMMAQGEQVHISTWPAIWPTRMAGEVSIERSDGVGAQKKEKKKSDGVNYDNIAANKTRAAAHCFEAKCFGVLCSGVLDGDAIEKLLSLTGDSESVRATIENSSRAATMFLGPTGALLPGYVVDGESGEKTETDMLQMEEGILYADMDVAKCIEGKQYHDVVGGYQRLDIFDLKVDRRRREPAVFVDNEQIIR